MVYKFFDKKSTGGILVIEYWSPSWFDVILCNNLDKHFTARSCHFLPIVIIRRITWSRCSELCFQMYACLISFSLYGTTKTLTTIDLLFVSNFFQSLVCEGNVVSFLSYYFKKGLIFIFSADLLWFVHGLMQRLLHAENIYYN